MKKHRTYKHKKIDHHPTKCTGGLMEQIQDQTLYYKGGITVEEFDKWIANVLYSREDNLEKKSLNSNFKFIRKTLWESSVICPECKTEMNKMKFQHHNNVDVYQCPSCLYWTTFDEWYEIHLDNLSKRQLEQNI
jgi:uncharacterized protein with PIN domain